MLEPQDRRLLLESLRPPPGYLLSYAVSTTFSLDLMALLTAPLAFTFFDWESADGRPTADPIALLEAIRRYADRMTVFCQAGEIKLPKADQRLFAYLEHCVHEVLLGEGRGVFHPKVWILRFTDRDEVVIYRMICSSRNLTFDRSWDAVLVLDGALVARTNAYAKNHPLADFVQALPTLCPRTPDNAVLTEIDRMQNELRRVNFEAPEAMEVMGFYPLGIPGYTSSPFRDRIDQMLVISPFLSASYVEKLGSLGKQSVLVSRADQLDTVAPEILGRFGQVYAFDTTADEALLEEDTVPADESIPESDATDEALCGLHAKLYIADAGWNTRIWLGSANATQAAFHRNVEFLVELQGKKSAFGIASVLGRTGKEAALIDFLVPYSVRSDAVTDADSEALNNALLEARLAIARFGFVASVSRRADDGLFDIAMHGANPDSRVLERVTSMQCWPVTCRAEAFAKPVAVHGADITVEFRGLPFELISSFFAFEITVAAGEKTKPTRFVLNVLLQGAPEDRKDRLLKYLLRNQDEFMRYLMLLLAVGAEPDGAFGALQSVGGSYFGNAQSLTGIPLFEVLVRALDMQPEHLDQIARLVEDLRRTEDGRSLIPDGFDALWAPIWEARQGISTDGR